MADRKGDGVILLHGLGRTAGSMRPLERALQYEGFATLRLDYPGRRMTLLEIVNLIAPKIEEFQSDIAGLLHFVTHSLGGLVARAFLAAHRPNRLGRVVMLAPPNNGSEWADLAIRLRVGPLVLGPVGRSLAIQGFGTHGHFPPSADYPLGVIAGNRALDPIFPRLVIAGPNDGKVSIESTRLAGMTDHVVLPVSHTLMTASRLVARETVMFLQTGQFTQPA